jgi:hypothetical protein
MVAVTGSALDLTWSATGVAVTGGSQDDRACRSDRRQADGHGPVCDVTPQIATGLLL